MKTQYRAVVVGGGVVGTSLLYHLCKMGWEDTVLLEKLELTSTDFQGSRLRNCWRSVQGSSCFPGRSNQNQKLRPGPPSEKLSA